uniref:Uncharacterized protein n=2 Tax=Canis lupus familiaris TaxID=9615 RepID=A0A8I3P8B8_CANLF
RTVLCVCLSYPAPCESYFAIFPKNLLCLFFNQNILQLSSFCMLDIDPLSDRWFVNIFSHSVGFLFILLIVSFAVQKILIWCGPIC